MNNKIHRDSQKTNKKGKKPETVEERKKRIHEQRVEAGQKLGVRPKKRNPHRLTKRGHPYKDSVRPRPPKLSHKSLTPEEALFCIETPSERLAWWAIMCICVHAGVPYYVFDHWSARGGNYHPTHNRELWEEEARRPPRPFGVNTLFYAVNHGGLAVIEKWVAGWKSNGGVKSESHTSLSHCKADGYRKDNRQSCPTSSHCKPTGYDSNQTQEHESRDYNSRNYNSNHNTYVGERVIDSNLYYKEDYKGNFESTRRTQETDGSSTATPTYSPTLQQPTSSSTYTLLSPSSPTSTPPISTVSQCDADQEGRAIRDAYLKIRGLTPETGDYWHLSMKKGWLMIPDPRDPNYVISRNTAVPPNGKGAQRYNYPRGALHNFHFIRKGDTTGIIFICEGQIDALTLWQLGFSAIAVRDINRLTDELPDAHTFIVMQDADDHGRSEATTWADVLEQMERRVLVCLPPFEQRDVNNALVQLGEDAVKGHILLFMINNKLYQGA
ncbi:MAG: toprim domain-containing protein [Lentisphaeria bacterium]|nr:toprim domain-containing protein [Lentisphaeria bacterium]